MNSYKALIFDLGKVVFDYSFDLTFQYWAKASCKTFDDIKNNFKYDEVFNRFERNEITPEQFRKTISKRLGLSLTDKQFDKGWCSLYMNVFPGIEELLDQLKKEYALVALTNTNCIHATVWKEKYAGILKYFDKVFSSHEMKTRKPEAKAYLSVLHYLNSMPEETIFLDDVLENVKEASSLGIKSILVTSPKQMKEELGRCL